MIYIIHAASPSSTFPMEGSTSWSAIGRAEGCPATFSCLSHQRLFTTACNGVLHTWSQGPLGYGRIPHTTWIPYCAIHHFKHNKRIPTKRKSRCVGSFWGADNLMPRCVDAPSCPLVFSACSTNVPPPVLDSSVPLLDRKVVHYLTVLRYLQPWPHLGWVLVPLRLPGRRGWLRACAWHGPSSQNGKSAFGEVEEVPYSNHLVVHFLACSFERFRRNANLKSSRRSCGAIPWRLFGALTTHLSYRLWWQLSYWLWDKSLGHNGTHLPHGRGWICMDHRGCCHLGRWQDWQLLSPPHVLHRMKHSSTHDSAQGAGCLQGNGWWARHDDYIVCMASALPISTW